MSNIYVNAINARIEANANAEKQLTASNIEKLRKAARILSNDKLFSMLDKSKVNVEFATLNVYTIDKFVNFCSNAILFTKNFNNMNKHVLLTAMLCAKHEETMTTEDAKNACSKHREVSKERKHLVFQNESIVDESTVRAQHSSSMNALICLNVLKHVPSETRERRYAIDVKNVFYKAFEKELSALIAA